MLHLLKLLLLSGFFLFSVSCCPARTDTDRRSIQQQQLGARRRRRRSLTTPSGLLQPPRGGGSLHGSSSSLIEINPDYVPPLRLAEGHPARTFLDRSNRSTPPRHSFHARPGGSFVSGGGESTGEPSHLPPYVVETTSLTAFETLYRPNPPAHTTLRQFLEQLNGQNGPAICNTAALCMVVFGLWQVPAARPALSKWFVCSPANPPAAAVLSSVSHAGLTHLLFNLVSLFTFGGPVRAALASVPRGWPVWPLMLGSAVSGSVFHLILGSGRNVGGCMGLSDVTMALFAVYARLYPRHSLGFLLAGVVPVRMQASRLLGFMAAWSGAGTLLSRTRARATNIGHAAHLGGILFGLAYFEAWSRRRQWRSWIISHAIKLGRQ